MKKALIAVGILAAFGVALYWFPSKVDTFKPKQVSIAPLVLRPTQKVVPSLRIPSSNVKNKIESKTPLDDFHREELELFNQRYALVVGAYATVEVLRDKQQMHSFGGFHIYEQRDEHSAQVVFDKEKNQYGVFTGELKIYGNYMKLLPILESNGFEIMYKNVISGEIIIRVENLENQKAFDQVLAVPNTRVVPDIKFSRLRGM